MARAIRSIQGFATDISVNTGETVSFKVKTDSINYRIDIYRLGYYGGAGARLMAADRCRRRRCRRTSRRASSIGITGLADCGNWNVSASWSTAGRPSGIYLARLTTDRRRGREPYRVHRARRRAAGRRGRPDFRHDVAGLQPVRRRQPLCGGPFSNAGPSTPPRAPRDQGELQPAVRYARPRCRSFLFNAEYPMVRWLEANGYDVKYSTGVDTERRAANWSAREAEGVLLRRPR